MDFQSVLNGLAPLMGPSQWFDAPRPKQLAAGVASGLLLSGLVLVTPGAAPVQAITLAEWAIGQLFPSPPPTGTSYRPPNLPSAAGTPSGGLLAGNPLALLTGVHASSATTYSSPAGNGSTYAFSSNTWQPGDYYEVKLPTTGYTGLSISWDQTRTSQGPAAFKLQYSIGAGFIDRLSYTVANTTWSSSTYNSASTLTSSLPAEAGNQSTLVLRFLNNESASSNPGATNRIDNIVITGTGSAIPVPAPLPIVGAGAAFGFSRRLRQRLRLARSQGAELP